MEFKLNAFVSSMMLAVIFVIVVDSRLINTPYNNKTNEENYYYGVPVYTPSRECSTIGGICVQEGDCEKGQIVYKIGYKFGLCEDHEMGVECCYKVVPREAPCKQFNGECIKDCRRNELQQEMANDCLDGDKCCVLVQ